MAFRNKRTGTVYAEVDESSWDNGVVMVRTASSTWFPVRTDRIEEVDVAKDNTPRERLEGMIDPQMAVKAMVDLLIELGAAPTWDADTAEKAMDVNLKPLCNAYGLPWVGDIGSETLDFWQGVKDGG